MAQFDIDVESGIVRISQLIYGICPGMSQATLFPRVFVVYALIREELVHLKRVRNTSLTCVTFCWAQLLVNALPADCLPIVHTFVSREQVIELYKSTLGLAHLRAHLRLKHCSERTRRRIVTRTM